MNKILIVFVKPVVFNDADGTVLRSFNVGDIVPASEGKEYFLTSMGGIHWDEARIVNALELITYRHLDDLDGHYRYRQYAKDSIPVWAVDFRLDSNSAY